MRNLSKEFFFITPHMRNAVSDKQFGDAMKQVQRDAYAVFKLPFVTYWGITETHVTETQLRRCLTVFSMLP